MTYISQITDFTDRKGSYDSISVVIAIVIGLIFAAAVVASAIPLLEDGFSSIFGLSGDNIG